MTPREEESVASGGLYREDSMVSTVFKWNARIAGVGVERGVGRAVRGTRRLDQKAGEAPKRMNSSVKSSYSDLIWSGFHQWPIDHQYLYRDTTQAG